jgi:ribosomal protein S18 acetylase RimI-like enzyme
VPSGPELLELGKSRFLDELDAVLGVYAAAMNPPRAQLPGRKAIMDRHASFPSFRAVVVTVPAEPDDRTRPPAGSRWGEAERSEIVGFTYGFHGGRGQWWHDLVRSSMISAFGRGYADDWLGNTFEVAEVHVHPEYQGRGIGRAMVPALCHPRLERTAVLSTQDAESPARRLYRSLGFTDLITGFRFPGSDPPYAVMGAVLPLRD